MKRTLVMLIISLLFLMGCSSGQKQKVEKFVQDAFKARADAVFTYKDKEPLLQYFSPKAMEQSRDYLNWSPREQWSNIKDLKYSTQVRFEKISVDGKTATATVYETAIITWDYIDPSQVMGTAFVKEDAWSNKKHTLLLTMTPEGKWIIDEDIMN